MKSILAAALLANTALATPLNLQSAPNTTNGTILPRDGAVGEGVDSGIKISTFNNVDCTGGNAENIEMRYAINISQQIRSYRLSDDLGQDDDLVFWSDPDWTPSGWKPVDDSLVGNPAACAIYAYQAMPNQVKKGCHTLPNVLSCVNIMIDQTPQDNK